jgi:hypothetical protein
VLTKKAFIGDTLLMPISLYELAARTPMSATLPNQTVLNWLLSADSRSGIKQILDIDELETAGPGGTRMMVAYEKNPRVLQQRIALPMTMHPPQAKNLEFLIPIEAKFAGVVVRYPVACQFSFGM